MKLNFFLLAASFAIAASVVGATQITVDVQSCVDAQVPHPVAYIFGGGSAKSISPISDQKDVFTFDVPDFSGQIKIQVYLGGNKPKGSGESDDDLDVGVPYTLVTLQKTPSVSKPSTIAQERPQGYQVTYPEPWLSDATFYSPSGPTPFQAASRSLIHTTTKPDQDVGILYCRLIADERLSS